MQPNDTPAIGRYNAQLKYDGESWSYTVQHNTIGTITHEGGLVMNSSGLFRLNYTNVKAQTVSPGPLEYVSVLQLTANMVELSLDTAPSVNDIVLIEIEVFNT